MNQKIGLGIAMMASFGFMACSSSSSSSGDETTTASCSVTSEDPLTLKSTIANLSGTITYELKDGNVVETSVMNTTDMADEVCADYQTDDDYTSVECDGKTVVATSVDEYTEALFESYKKEVISECKEIDGKTITVDENGDWDID
ncbi:MAG: hypothetical protein K6A31_08800 [Fibrobacter sp.]|nr:hypothetical protein [Fibrobacter sp.]